VKRLDAGLLGTRHGNLRIWEGSEHGNGGAIEKPLTAMAAQCRDCDRSVDMSARRSYSRGQPSSLWLHHNSPPIKSGLGVAAVPCVGGSLISRLGRKTLLRKTRWMIKC
jgi:hypothetical protein